MFEEFLNSNLKPIPLTVEWLQKFRFEEAKAYDEVTRHTKGSFSVLSCLYFENGNPVEEIGIRIEGMEPPLKFVHQLQNLYFCLCGEELELRN